MAENGDQDPHQSKFGVNVRPWNRCFRNRFIFNNNFEYLCTVVFVIVTSDIIREMGAGPLRIGLGHSE